MKSIKTLVMVFVMGMFVISCTVSNVSIDTPTEVATETRIPATVTPTATLQLTSTAQPTITATPLPSWVADFAEPILNSISTHLPDYEDDFSNSRSGWFAGPIPFDHEKWGSGETGYLDGAYYIKTLPSYHNQTDWSVLPSMSDMVVEMDIRFASVDSGDFQVHFRHGRKSRGYMVTLTSDKEIKIAHYNKDKVADVGVAAVNWNCREFCRLLIFVRGPEIAVYLNSDPVLHAYDEEFEQYKGAGDFNLVCGNFTDKMTQVIYIDNFRLWNISDLP